MSNNPQFDWSCFFTNFICGVIFGPIFSGALFGFLISPATGLLLVLLSAAFFGLIAGFFGDHFWRSIRNWWW